MQEPSIRLTEVVPTVTATGAWMPTRPVSDDASTDSAPERTTTRIVLPGGAAHPADGTPTADAGTAHCLERRAQGCAPAWDARHCPAGGNTRPSSSRYCGVTMWVITIPGPIEEADMTNAHLTLARSAASWR